MKEVAVETGGWSLGVSAGPGGREGCGSKICVPVKCADAGSRAPELSRNSMHSA